LSALRTSEVTASAVRSSALRAANQEVAKTTAKLGFSRVARQVGERIGWRVAAGSVPVAGAFIGGSVDAWYLREVSLAARRAFQWRWLLQQRGVESPNPQ
ncbi:MAG TPA: EcsC family protein, partial [Nevskiaceae bacterium]|nr:EcsC family protein [Nevskiaceae bacterium]